MSESVADTLAHILPQQSKRIALRVTRRAEKALRRGHPWLFDQSIVEKSHAGNPGDLAVIFDRKRDFLAAGLYDPLSPIRVRVLVHRQPENINRDFFRKGLENAARLREPLPGTTTGYRLVSGENDGFPGLVIDRYAETVVVKLYTHAWLPHLMDVLESLDGVLQAERIILRFSRELIKHPENLHGLRDGQPLKGDLPNAPILFQENGLWFEADPIKGHKTGFYLDQRDNRARVGELSKGKTVLNLFAYTGGFSLYAAHGGAHHVTSVDISQKAMAAAKRNFEHNHNNPNVKACKHEIIAADVFKQLNTFASEKRRFDLVVIDPPSFAKQRKEVAQAIAAYKQLTRLGLKILIPGGMLVQSSCSSRVESDSFFDAVHQAAQSVGRQLREIERTFHPMDHPIHFKEGAYLKCLFAVG